MAKQTPSPGESYGTHVGKWLANDTELYTLYTLLGVVVGSVDFGSFTGLTLSDDKAAKTLFQELETMLETAYTILGLAVGATHFGTFTGSTLSDDENAKTLFQELETAIESSNENILINQDFSIWQENTTFTNPGNNVYVADGYYITKSDGDGTAPTINVKKNTTDMEVGFKQCCELEITNVGVQGTTVNQRLVGRVEDFEKYRGKSLTISIRVAASTTIGLTNGGLVFYDGVASYTVNITSITPSYVTYSRTFTVADAATEIRWYFKQVSTTGTISTTGSIYIQWMKLELGPVATPLIPEKTADSLDDSQRYYQKTYAQGVFPGAATEIGAVWREYTAVASADHTITIDVKFPKVMKAAPSVTLYDLAGNSGRVTMAAGDNIVGTVSQISDSGFKINATNGAAATSRKIAFHYVAESRV